MGVQNLLPLLAPVSSRVNLQSLKGKKVAVDGFVWLHRGAFGCAKELVNNPSTTKILSFLMKRLNRLLENGITPVIVFDGQQLPQKAKTNEKRRKERKEALELALEYEKRNMSRESYQCYERAVEINSYTVYTWIKQLKKFNIEYIVAPYEADAEMAYLARTGYVDYVLTEDSDLIVYQTPCTLFKLDDLNQVTMIRYDAVLNHLNLTKEEFILFCCLAGCDYIDHIPRLGIQTSLKYVSKFKTIEKVLEEIQKSPKFEVPDNYLESLKQAVLTFMAQKIYDPVDKKIKNLIPIENSPPFLGPPIPEDILNDLISGEIDTRTYAKISQTNEVKVISSSPYFRKSESQNVNENALKISDEKTESKSFKNSFCQSQDLKFQQQKQSMSSQESQPMLRRPDLRSYYQVSKK